MPTNTQQMEILNGWKEIANYMGRGVRSLQRPALMRPQMAELDLSFFSPCGTFGALLDRNVVASTKYHEASSELLSLAGQQKAAGFAKAKQNCKNCLDECKRTTAALRAHRAAHGC